MHFADIEYLESIKSPFGSIAKNFQDEFLSPIIGPARSIPIAAAAALTIQRAPMTMVLRLPPWTVCNFISHSQVTESLRLSVTADNVFDKMPPTDHSHSGLDNVPYNTINYNVLYGRFMFFDATYQLGR